MKKYLNVFYILMTITFVGCDTPIVPFEKLVLEQKVEEDILVEGIDSNLQNISVDIVNKIQDISSNIFETIGDSDYYYKNKNNLELYLSPIKDNLSKELYDSIKSNNSKNDLKKIIDNLYYMDDSNYYSSNIIALNLYEDELYADVEVIGVDDSKEFIINTISLYFDKDFKIYKTEIVSENNTSLNTTKPLSNDSLINGELAKEKLAVENLFNSIKNKELYTNIKRNKDGANEKLEIMLNDVDINKNSIEDLRLLFNIGRGEFLNYSITKCSINDVDSKAETKLELTFANGNTLTKFDVVYSRVTDKILEIKKK